MIHTIRFRLTVLYSGLLFVLATLVLGGIYFAVSKTTEQRPVSTEFAKTYSGNQYLGRREVVFVEEVENAVNVETMAALRKYSLLTLAGLYVASLGIGWVLSGRVLRPVRSITRTTEEIQATDLKRRIKLDGPRDELKDLADTIDTMLDRLEEAFSAQRQLIDDASHELRNPLTIIRANVDAVLAAPDASEEERARAVAIVDRATTRMTTLVEDLLATARRQGTAFADTEVDLAWVAGEACEEYAAPAAARDVTIVRELGTGLEMIGDADALRRSVANLLSNAVRLSPPGRHDQSGGRACGRLVVGGGPRRRPRAARGGPGAGVRPVLARRGQPPRPPHGPGPGHRAADRGVARGAGWRSSPGSARAPRSCSGCRPEKAPATRPRRSTP
ncbi:hypothetical protein GCM10020001_074030 [Nonomuraea salmonea]